MGRHAAGLLRRGVDRAVLAQRHAHARLAAIALDGTVPLRFGRLPVDGLCRIIAVDDTPAQALVRAHALVLEQDVDLAAGTRCRLGSVRGFAGFIFAHTAVVVLAAVRLHTGEFPFARAVGEKDAHAVTASRTGDHHAIFERQHAAVGTAVDVPLVHQVARRFVIDLEILMS